jgi:hypothetical protein
MKPHYLQDTAFLPFRAFNLRHGIGELHIRSLTLQQAIERIHRKRKSPECIRYESDSMRQIGTGRHRIASMPAGQFRAARARARQ